MNEPEGLLPESESPTPARPGAETETQTLDRGWAYRQVLAGSVRLHNLGEPTRLVAAVEDVVQNLMGPTQGTVGIFLPGQDARWISYGRQEVEGRPAEEVERAIRKVAQGLEPILLGTAEDGSFVVPLTGSRGALGGFCVRPKRLTRIDTPTMDLLVLLGRHLGAAMENALQTQELIAIGVLSEEERLQPNVSLRDARRFFEKRLVTTRLQTANGNIAAAARTLGMDRGQLSRMLKRYGIDREEYKTSARRRSTGGQA